ncbi:MAG: AraC family transcriptional regulator [Verrucomicrobiaceae bacterium]|nr:AraC family transcriptional regulator [Verrucomicrobiaceae bacterium]
MTCRQLISLQQIATLVWPKDGAKMQSLHDQAFTSDVRPHMRLEGRVDDKAYDLDIFDVEWTQPGEATFQPREYCFLELLYYPVTHLYGTYRGPSDQRQTIGKLLLVPPHTTLYTSWTTGHQKTLSCLFDLSRLGVLSGFEWQWDKIELQTTIDIKNPFLEALMTRLAEETANPSFASKLQIDSILSLIALELNRQFDIVDDRADMHDGKLSAAQINRVNEMLQTATTEGPSLIDLASACGLPPRELSERFKSSTGKTLRHFAAEVRIKKARALLSGEKYLIKEVAYLCGFHDAAAFTAAFRRKTGMTPQEFRQQSGNAADAINGD